MVSNFGFAGGKYDADIGYLAIRNRSVGTRRICSEIG
jgi:hypothetical protein